ncbi:hypothetical protein [Idiomarina piscisalsi]|uniref:CBS domain-containing protein n=1 Tax=Idiomarina piscisalsi TaxID=1096243 RepID=A0ABM6LRX1_9GAMM|nr:hypothetical protein [Idiomarina piscisalsi]ASG65245.1 hypothetical protein CEW91_03355 [Idiomarina piscisalsi]MTJ03053.1 hypothetical protein [Idiomarina piscisalsi]
MNEFKEIQWSSDEDKAMLHSRSQDNETASWTDNALRVMDDFDVSSPVQLSESTTLMDAEKSMRKQSQRYACIHNRNSQIIGLLALRELHGRKATQTTTSTQTFWEELTAKDLMTPLSALPQVSLKDVQKSRIGDAAATLKSSGRDFIVVISDGEVYGIISSLKIAELTGESVNVFHLPSTFAEIISAVTHKELID